MEIYISNLKKSYGQNVIFNGISLSISDNSVTCLFGISGCGKTTLINIIGQIEEGIREVDNNYLVEENREKAIGMAINMAEGGDMIVIAGKGHEDYQILADETIHFDDREVVREKLRLKLEK